MADPCQAAIDRGGVRRLRIRASIRINAGIPRQQTVVCDAVVVEQHVSIVDRRLENDQHLTSRGHDATVLT